jgi:hypothetical protein
MRVKSAAFLRVQDLLLRSLEIVGIEPIPEEILPVFLAQRPARKSNIVSR